MSCSLSRRAFLSGLGALGIGVAAGGAYGCSSPIPAWDTGPRPITPASLGGTGLVTRSMEHAEGRVVDATSGSPVAGASVASGPHQVRTDEHGCFTLESLLPGRELVVRAPGYLRARLAAGPGPLSIALSAHRVRAAYLSYYGVGDRTIRERVLGLVDRTELNAVVIDVKGDRGFVLYETEVPLAREARALGPVRIRDFDAILARLKAQGVYTIARIVVFKDNVLARHRPQWAVVDARTGRPWVDNEELAWLDPFAEEAWESAIGVAREAALKGFDEIQLDYLRFPADGALGAARYSRPNTAETRVRTISEFLRRARAALDPTGAFLAVDVFGYTAFNEDDTHIGQRIEDLAPLVDYLCPMAYPSAYRYGIPGYRTPVSHPYEIVFETVQRVRRRAGEGRARARPWIQDFRDYAFDRRPFGVAEVRAQMAAALEAGAVGWMLWNPRNEYTDAALGPAPREDPR